MRLRTLLLFDMRFQAKYGFYFLYGVLTIIYVIILLALPEGWRGKAASVLIFSDPAAMGLFFMGAIILLEKSQHAPHAFAVSPVRPMEYMAAKVGSLAVISLAVAVVLALAAGAGHLHRVLFGTAVSGVIFSMLGMIIATKIASLNQFLLWTVPVESVCFVPAILHLFKITPSWFRYYPANVCMDMVSGNMPSALEICIVVVLLAILFVVSRSCVLKMWDSAGGVKL